MAPRASVLLLTGLLTGALSPASAQWTHRYPKVDGYSHHVYLEGYELPTLALGPTDPAPSPDGSSLAFAARGWIWTLDLDSGIATRRTSGGEVDSRPAWAPDGRTIAFLRDDGSDLDIWSLELASGAETPLVESPAIELDPFYSAEGVFLYYSSAVAGDLDIWRLQVSTGESLRITSDAGLEVRPLALPDDERLVYLAKGRGGPDRIVERSVSGEGGREILHQSIVSQSRPALSPDGRTLAVNWPAPDDYELWLADLDNRDLIRLGARSGLPVSPAFSADGQWVYFVEADERQEFRLYRAARAGGAAEEVPVLAWDFGSETAWLRVVTEGAARLSVVDASGHPLVANGARPRFDGTHGRVFFYSPGVALLRAPAGRVRVSASRGFSSIAADLDVELTAGETREVRVELASIWDPREDGWYSGDHHYHMNYGGPYRLAPEDLVLELEAEDLDVGTPLVANLHHRLVDAEHLGFRRVGRGRPTLVFGQEIRSHFLGHVGVIGIDNPFWPWFWGPGYPVYRDDDRPNTDALDHARREGGTSSYMHPVSIADPFADADSLRRIPVELVPDAVLGDLDSLEIACLWTSEIGTAEVWYRLLNVGATVAASAGTDTMANFYRTMAVGTTRLYVRPGGPFELGGYLEALRAGRSFVSTGPLLDFVVDGARPGDVLADGSRAAAFELRVASSMPVERIEVLVNGVVVWESEGLSEPGDTMLRGTVALPAGGWLAARATGGDERWPGMNGTPFAHSSPIWIGSVGSVEDVASRKAAGELLQALEVALARVDSTYDGVDVPRIRARFEEARLRLETLASSR